MRSADLMPSTLLNFRWDEDAREEVARQPALREELVAQAVPATDDT